MRGGAAVAVSICGADFAIPLPGVGGKIAARRGDDHRPLQIARRAGPDAASVLFASKILFAFEDFIIQIGVTIHLLWK
ncbi:hypothetical protein KCP73_18750 [Salmonella enterica subsp. enterica]|nr:hypothetical protein KCP73_18750 [Salmonella enterica subsp. enterica]